jgi:prevent-host-death family protein
MLTRRSKTRRTVRTASWKVQDAKARFSEVIRRARAKGPQSILLHGKEVAVVVDKEEFDRLSGSAGTGEAVIDAFRDQRLGDDFVIEPISVTSPSRPPVAFRGRRG